MRPASVASDAQSAPLKESWNTGMILLGCLLGTVLLIVTGFALRRLRTLYLARRAAPSSGATRAYAAPHDALHRPDALHDAHDSHALHDAHDSHALDRLALADLGARCARDGLSVEEIDAVCPLFRVGPAHKLSDASEQSDDAQDATTVCAVCLEAVEELQRARRLPCAHVYHDPCAVLWLAKANRCPVCVRPVVERAAEEDAHCVSQTDRAMRGAPMVYGIFSVPNYGMQMAQVESPTLRRDGRERERASGMMPALSAVYAATTSWGAGREVRR